MSRTQLIPNSRTQVLKVLRDLEDPPGVVAASEESDDVAADVVA